MTTIVHHVNVCAPHGGSEGVAVFFEDVFGFSRIARPDTGRVGVWLSVGADGGEVHVSERDADPHPDQHVAFLVDDIDGVRSRAEARSAIVRDEGEQRFFVRDPAGNLVEVLGAADAAR